MNINRVEFIFKILIFLLIALFLCGCQSGIIYDPDTCVITIPPGWKTKKNFDGISLEAVSPLEGQNDVFQEKFNVVVEKIPKKMSLDKFYEKNLLNRAKGSPSLKVIETGRTIISGKKARWVIYYVDAEDIELRAIVYLVTRKRLGYAITFIATAESYSEYTTRFESVIESFKFI